MTPNGFHHSLIRILLLWTSMMLRTLYTLGLLSEKATNNGLGDARRIEESLHVG